MGKPANATTYRKATIDLAAAEKPRIVVEVGVYAGILSKMFCALPTVERLTIVDSWLAGYCDYTQAHMDGIANSVITWAMTEPKAHVLRMDSAAATAWFEDESIDFFHTDGDHSLEGIRKDIRCWLPKVKTGCILSGDNYEVPTVAKGVDEAFPNRQLLANGRLWWVRK